MGMKKHQASSQTPVRRKKTRAEISDHNRKRDLQQKHNEVIQQPKWEDLDVLHRHCIDLLGAMRPVSAIFVDKELLAAMGNNILSLRDMAASLTNDIKEYSSVLRDIRAKHEGKTGVIEDPNDLFAMYGLGEEYNRWTASYESVIIPTIQDIMNLVRQFLPEDKTLPT